MRFLKELVSKTTNPTGDKFTTYSSYMRKENKSRAVLDGKRGFVLTKGLFFDTLVE
jgi:hypothetical protein